MARGPRSCRRRWSCRLRSDRGGRPPRRARARATDHARPGGTCSSWRVPWPRARSWLRGGLGRGGLVLAGLPIRRLRRLALAGAGCAARRDGDVHALVGARRRARLPALRAHVVHQERSRDFVLSVGEPGLLREPYRALAHVVDDLVGVAARELVGVVALDRKSTRLNSSHLGISYAV